MKRNYPSNAEKRKQSQEAMHMVTYPKPVVANTPNTAVDLNGLRNPPMDSRGWSGAWGCGEGLLISSYCHGVMLVVATLAAMQGTPAGPTQAVATLAAAVLTAAMPTVVKGHSSRGNSACGIAGSGNAVIAYYTALCTTGLC
ncbi:hypothetical protein EOD39_8638 [Acipenser ruthenus]|uniref:Uncharacterized protein n=1 Tax=Acipenser ruthenus TaxID=7906 RepID=A0A444U3A1_ACIRT|nr:hypothetical protein EOD39_8638 [Acipenser ruthenus]